jgi:pimeloyl-ACP methyl ester carboxylesterase
MGNESPSKFLLGLEAVRGAYEYGLAWALSVPLRHIAPKGDGHPVIVFPGLGTTDSSTQYLRDFLSGIGYSAYPWEMGRNLGPRQGLDRLLKDISIRVQEVSEQHNGQSVSIIGWSLGGIYGREIAKDNSDSIRQVITLGTPFKGDAAKTNATFLYEFLSKDVSHRDPDIIKKISQPPPVPFTSIYSRSDGVVHCKCSIEDLGYNTENIEVPGASHLGLGHNPIAMYVIADRLQYSKHNWKPYQN